MLFPLVRRARAEPTPRRRIRVAKGFWNLSGGLIFPFGDMTNSYPFSRDAAIGPGFHAFRDAIPWVLCLGTHS